MANGRPRWPHQAAWALLVWVGCTAPAPDTTPSSTRYGLAIVVDGRMAGTFEGRGQAAWVHDVVAEGLRDARWFRAEDAQTTLPAILRYEERRAPQEVPVLRVRLVVEPDDALAASLDAAGLELDAHVELERRDETLVLRRDLPVAVQRAIALLDATVTAAREPPSTLAALLHDEDPEVVLVALDGIERRRLRSLGDAVAATLSHPEERVALRAVECLGVVGGPEHTPGMLRVARLADRAHANRLYDALANLGGEHARGFLEFAVRNEEDPELAMLAQRALARLQRAEPTQVAQRVERGHRQ